MAGTRSHRSHKRARNEVEDGESSNWEYCSLTKTMCRMVNCFIDYLRSRTKKFYAGEVYEVWNPDRTMVQESCGYARNEKDNRKEALFIMCGAVAIMMGLDYLAMDDDSDSDDEDEDDEIKIKSFCRMVNSFAEYLCSKTKRAHKQARNQEVYDKETLFIMHFAIVIMIGLTYLATDDDSEDDDDEGLIESIRRLVNSFSKSLDNWLA